MREAEKHEEIIGWAVFKAGIRAPEEWDYDTKKAMERAVRKALEEEDHDQMDQDEANHIA